MKPRSARVFEWMATRVPRRWLVLALLLMSISLASAATTTDSGVTGGSLAGQLLIASPDMDDPRFAQTVILMVQHSKDGALGIIINRPVGELSYAELLKSIGETGSAANGKVRIYAGFVLHSRDYHRPETLDIDGRIAMTASPNVLRDIAAAKGPKKSLIAFGYAG